MTADGGAGNGHTSYNHQMILVPIGQLIHVSTFISLFHPQHILALAPGRCFPNLPPNLHGAEADLT